MSLSADAEKKSLIIVSVTLIRILECCNAIEIIRGRCAEYIQASMQFLVSTTISGLLNEDLI